MLAREQHACATALPPLAQVVPRRDYVALPADRFRIEDNPATGVPEPAPQVEILASVLPVAGETRIEATDRDEHFSAY